MLTVTKVFSSFLSLKITLELKKLLIDTSLLAMKKSKLDDLESCDEEDIDNGAFDDILGTQEESMKFMLD
ncbi:hypothetical protein L2E82_36450 [Cichorium intybus]|uniref:Uncharacterized protein n=1 Tax=Cichorium intybus TaxID=13427 RepID=A0ACB9BRR4_CICIN|nr:hypothetical protein L2E82_36450 [Cichorium intybus]